MIKRNEAFHSERSAGPGKKRLAIKFIGGLLLLIIIIGSVGYYVAYSTSTEPTVLNQRLLSLPANQWIKLYQPWRLDWRRQAHAGIAYDTNRNTLLVFGSDTHNENWDNSVHEFDPVTGKWTTHYPPAPKESYRSDTYGHAIAGEDGFQPWAMHSYDNVVYDPLLDALVVTGKPEHNPVARDIPEAKIHPTWIYDLKTRAWKIFENNGQTSPTFFAAASAYDTARDTVVAYKHGVWELGPERREWQLATKERHHEMHFNMAYDSLRQKLFVFGDYTKDNDVWMYTPGREAGVAGVWEKRQPTGDACPKGGSFPVAYDNDHGVFLLVLDNYQGSYINKDKKPVKASNSVTCIYDPDLNSYSLLPNAELEALGMNYMMVYEKKYKVFLLVTGDWRTPPTVWALKLDLLRIE